MKKKNLILVLLIPLVCSSCSTKQYPVSSYRTTMEFHDNFRVLQLADLHFGIETDLRMQLDLLTDAIEEANPDLILLTGDNFMYASKEIVNSLIDHLNSICSTRSNSGLFTKFAMTFGNHDNQGDYPRYYINDTLAKYASEDGKELEENKFAAYVDYQNDNLFGLTNYYIDLVDNRTKSLDTVDVKYRIHIIDSNTYHFTGIKYGYDVIHDEQLQHAIDIYNNATTDKDYIGIGVFHIPLEEFQDAQNQYKNSDNPDLIGQGDVLEDVLPPYKNNGSYQKLKEANICSFIVGHNHKIASDVIYNASSSNIEDKAIFSFGVKSTNQLYHSEDLLGYKVYNLKDDMTKEEFVSIENLNANFISVTNRGEKYEK